MHVRVGDQDGIILHTPGHSEDSICVYLPGTGTIFSGDTLFHISDDTGSYPRAYRESLERLCLLDIRGIYPGHGLPVQQGAQAFIRGCLEHVSRSLVID